jgi:hypothetical protein
MSAVVGLAMVLAAILIGRAAKVAVPLVPPRWWVSETMSAFVIAPAIVTMFAGGVAAFASWVIEGGWRAPGVATLVGLAADIAIYVFLSRLITAWALRVIPVAPVVPLQPQPSGSQPPLKKAA